LANDDAINDFLPEESGEPRPASRPRQAATSHASSAGVHASSHVDTRERVSEVDFEELFSQIESDERAPREADSEPAPQVDFDELADIYASPSSPEMYRAEPSVAAALNGWPDDGNVAVHQRPAPYESRGGIKVVAALATVGMLTIMYAVFVNERSFSPLSMLSRVTAPAPTPAPEPDLLPSLAPPVVSYAFIPPRSVRPRPYLNDGFGLIRGLSPSIPLKGFDVPPRSAAADKATRPAAAAAAPVAAAPKPSPSRIPAPTPSVSTPPPTAPPTVTAPPPATASVPRSAAPSAAPAPSTSDASGPSTASLAPTPAPAPARSADAPPAPPAASPPAANPPAASAVVENQKGIQSTLARYRNAFSDLDANAAREVWPTVNERSLSRAFDRLEEQDVSFDRCRIEVTKNDRAEATCSGTARYVPRVGSRTPRVDQREWRFSLVKVKDQWLIGAVDAR
jgi:hypothetical protein